MLRKLLLYLSSAGWVRGIVTGWGIARRVALRFVAGESQDDAVETVRALNGRGMTATLDFLGESITKREEAEAVVDEYTTLLGRIHDEGLDSWVSVKLTALGMDIDPMLAYENMRQLLGCARDYGIRVAIDMEDSAITQQTLDIFYKLRQDDGFDNVRAVIQAYLYRSEEDIEQLAADGAGVRLCKGAYREPASVAFPEKSDVDANYIKLSEILLNAAAQGRGYPGIATHDEAMIDAAKQVDAPKDRYEFQMLYGVREQLQEALVDDGYNMRVYVPYGSEWYPYFMRRLAERPANLWFFLSNFFRR